MSLPLGDGSPEGAQRQSIKQQQTAWVELSVRQLGARCCAGLLLQLSFVLVYAEIGENAVD